MDNVGPLQLMLLINRQESQIQILSFMSIYQRLISTVSSQTLEFAHNKAQIIVQFSDLLSLEFMQITP